MESLLGLRSEETQLAWLCRRKREEAVCEEAAQRPPRYHCDECGGDKLLIDEGSVCVECGLVDAEESVAQEAHMQGFIDFRGRHVPHRYERVVHFKNFLTNLTGRASLNMCREDLHRLSAELDGVDCTPSAVSSALRKLKIEKRHRKRLYALCAYLSKGTFVPITIEFEDYQELVKLFCRAEWAWRFHKDTIAPKRKVLLSTKFLFAQFCTMIGKPELARDVETMHSAKLRTVQWEQWERLKAQMIHNVISRPIIPGLSFGGLEPTRKRVKSK